MPSGPREDRQRAGRSLGGWLKAPFAWGAGVLGGALGGLVERAARRKLPARTGFAPGAPVVGPGLSGWTDHRGDQARAFRHWVYVAVDLIATRVACQFPNVGHVRRADPDPAKWATSPFHRQKALTPLFGQDDLERADHEHPLVRLFADPNDPDTAYDLWYETVLFLLLTGSAYWWVAKNPVTGLPAAIWVLPSHWVFPVFDNDGVVTGYDLRPAEGNYLRRQFPADEVIHFRKKSPISKVDGYSPQTAGAQWIDTQLAVDRSRWYTFKNGAFPNAVLEFDQEYLDPDEDALARIEAKFMARYAGETRAGKPILLPPGVKLKPLTVSPREMDYGKTGPEIRDNILALYHVPAEIAGIITGMSGQALLTAATLFYGNAVNPLCRQVGQAATEYFRAAYDDPSLRVWFDDHTPDDPAMVEKRIQSDLDGLAISPNEIRLLRGRKPWANGGEDPFAPHLGLVMPWQTGDDFNAVNPFTHEFGRPNAKPGKNPPPTDPDPSAGE